MSKIRLNGVRLDSNKGLKAEQFNEETRTWEPFEATEEGDIVSNKVYVSGFNNIQQQVDNLNNQVDSINGGGTGNNIITVNPTLSGDNKVIELTNVILPLQFTFEQLIDDETDVKFIELVHINPNDVSVGKAYEFFENFIPKDLMNFTVISAYNTVSGSGRLIDNGKDAGGTDDAVINTPVMTEGEKIIFDPSIGTIYSIRDPEDPNAVIESIVKGSELFQDKTIKILVKIYK